MSFKHRSHDSRFSDSSFYDEVCKACGATDIAGGGWGKLAEPCPAAPDWQPNSWAIADDLSEVIETTDGFGIFPTKLDALDSQVARLEAERAVIADHLRKAKRLRRAEKRKQSI